MFVRVIASVFVIALMSGCAAQNHSHNAYVTKAEFERDIARVEAAAKAAEDAAKRAQVSADKAEVIFNKGLQK